MLDARLEALAVILPITTDIYLTNNEDCALGVESVQGGLLQVRHSERSTLDCSDRDVVFMAAALKEMTFTVSQTLSHSPYLPPPFASPFSPYIVCGKVSQILSLFNRSHSAHSSPRASQGTETWKICAERIEA